jgi:hypothetical protein
MGKKAPPQHATTTTTAAQQTIKENKTKQNKRNKDKDKQNKTKNRIDKRTRDGLDDGKNAREILRSATRHHSASHRNTTAKNA